MINNKIRTIYEANTLCMLRLTNNIVIAIPIFDYTSVNHVLSTNQKINILSAYKKDNYSYMQCLIRYGFIDIPKHTELYKSLEDKPDEYLIQERTRFINKGAYLELFNITSKTIPAELLTSLISKYDIADEEIKIIEDVLSYKINQAKSIQSKSVLTILINKWESEIPNVKSFIEDAKSFLEKEMIQIANAYEHGAFDFQSGRYEVTNGDGLD